MFRTLKGKIIFFVALVMVTSTAVNIYFTMRDVGDAMLAAQEKSARNILHSLDLVLRDDYQNLLKAKRSMTLAKREQLKNAAAMIESVLNGFYLLPAEQSSLVPDPVKHALTWLGKAPFKKIDCYLIDKQSNLLFSSNSDVTSDVFQQIEDVKHRKISQVMQFQNLKKNGDFAIFGTGDEKRPVLAYFLPFDPWKLTIAVSVDIDDIEAEAMEKQKKIISSLSEYARQLRITKNGFVLMIDENHQVLIPPPGHIKIQLNTLSKNLTGNMAIKAIKSSGTHAFSKIRYAYFIDDKLQTLIVYSSYFKPLNWYTSVVVPLNEINRPARELVLRQSLIVAGMLLLGLIAVFLLVTRIATPLNLLSSYAKELPDLDFSRPLVKETPIDTLPQKYGDEVGNLAASFIFMKKQLNRNIQDLVEITASRQAIESELNIAHEIQLGMVPKTFPPFPESKEFDLYAVLRPAREIGGDLYDFFKIDEEHICFTLGDVSDKGIPAALFMVVTRTLIRTVGENQLSPAGMMKKINNALSIDNPRSMFVTLVIGILNIKTGEIKYANGGHNPPILISREKGASFIQDKNEPLVGAMPNMSYTDKKLIMAPGDSFFLYTDGVNEAMDINDVQYSNDKLLSEVCADKNASPEQLIHSILNSLMDHAQTAPQSDDIAMLTVQYLGPDN